MNFLTSETRTVENGVVSETYQVQSNYYLIVAEDIGYTLQNLGGNSGQHQVKIEIKHVNKIWRVNHFADGYSNSELFDISSFATKTFSLAADFIMAKAKEMIGSTPYGEHKMW